MNPTPDPERTVAPSPRIDADTSASTPTDADPETGTTRSPNSLELGQPADEAIGRDDGPIREMPNENGQTVTIILHTDEGTDDRAGTAIHQSGGPEPDQASSETAWLPGRIVAPAGTENYRPDLSTGDPLEVHLSRTAIGSAVADSGKTGVQGEVAPIEAQTGPRVPGYRILGTLGRGGMGVVYRATDLRLNRMVALKMVLAGDHAGEEARVRFQQEAQAVARLQHPNIVQIFEVGETGGLPFCSLEFVAGGTLAAALASTPQDPVAAARRAVVLVRAMDAVHSAGIIHRDLKPANVLLAPDGTPKITDFGLAKRLDEGSAQTIDGQILGTPSYMAPEQARGQLDRIGPLSDVWALGAILYEMLTGRPPFRGTGARDTLIQVVSEEPVPVRRLQPGCPRDLETVCLKCLEKEPAKRYSSAAELAKDLDRFLGGHPILARRAGPIERTAKWARRSPLRAGLAATVALCLGLFVILLVLQSQADRQKATLAQNEATLAQKALEESLRHDRARSQFATFFAEAERHAADTRPEAATWERVVQSLKSADQVAETDPEAFTEWPLRSSAQSLLARANAALTNARLRELERGKLTRLEGLHSDAVFFATLATGLGLEDNQERVRQAVTEGLALFQIDIAGDGPPRVTPGFFTPDELRTVTSRCYELLLLDAQAQAQARAITGETVGELRARVREAIRRLDRADCLLPETKTRSGLTQRAVCMAGLGKKDESEAIAKEAEGTAPVLATDYFLLGLGHYRVDEFPKAIQALVAALRAEPGHYGARYLLAVCHLRRGQFAEAKNGLTLCLKQRPGFIWPRLLRASAEMDLARQGLGNYQAARDDLDAVLVNPPDDAARYVALTNRGVLAICQGDWDAAATHLQEAINRRPDALPAYINLALTHRKRAEDPRVFALALAPTGTIIYPAAFAHYRRQVLDESVSVLDEAIRRQPEVSRLYHERGRIHLLRGDSTLARADLARAVLYAKTSGGISTLADDLLELGRLMQASGEYSNAAQTYAAILRFPGDLIAGEKRALAARHMAEPLIALKKWKEAAAAIDIYLKLTPMAEGQALPDGQSQRMAEALKLRGLIHADQNDQRAALDDYTRALGFAREPEILVLRGWAYHAMGAAGLGLKDFEEVLRLRPGHSIALLGRAEARVKSGQFREALADADEALRNAPADIRSQTRLQFRYNASRVYAQLAQSEPNPDAAGRHLTRTAELLRQVLSDSPLADRPRLWKELVMADPVLRKMILTPAMAGVAAEFGNRDR